MYERKIERLNASNIHPSKLRFYQIVTDISVRIAIAIPVIIDLEMC